MKKFAPLACNIKPSPTLAITALANRLMSEGADLVKLTAGEPDMPAAEHIIEAGIAALKEGKTKYTAVGGIPELKQAIVDKFATDNQLTYETSQVIANSGAKQALFHCAQAIISPGDEVIIPAPYWVSYPDIGTVFGAQNVIIPTQIDNDFKIDADQLRQAITAKTRLLILNSPGNPTGSVYSRSELEKLAEVLLEHPDIWIISDDIYEKIYWADEPFVNIVNVCPDLIDRCCVVNGVSKSYALTGLRLGYCAGPKDLIRLITNIQSQATSNPSSVAQYMALAALTGDQSSVQKNNVRYQSSCQLMFELLNKIEGIQTRKGLGAFYLFPDCSDLIQRLDGVEDDIGLCQLLLEKAGLVVVSGSSFGSPNYIRLSYATHHKTIEEGVARLAKFVDAAL